VSPLATPPASTHKSSEASGGVKGASEETLMKGQGNQAIQKTICWRERGIRRDAHERGHHPGGNGVFRGVTSGN